MVCLVQSYLMLQHQHCRPRGDIRGWPGQGGPTREGVGPKALAWELLLFNPISMAVIKEHSFSHT